MKSAVSVLINTFGIRRRNTTKHAGFFFFYFFIRRIRKNTRLNILRIRAKNDVPPILIPIRPIDTDRNTLIPQLFIYILNGNSCIRILYGHLCLHTVINIVFAILNFIANCTPI